MHTQNAIDAHGATAVHKAANRYMEGNTTALEAVGLNVGGLGDAWRVMRCAHPQMDMMAVVENQTDVAAKLAKF